MTFSNDEMLCLCLLGGAVPLGYGAWLIKQEFEPRKWRRAPGRILSSRINIVSPGEGEAHSPVVEYEFQLDQQTYKSSQRRVVNYSSGRRADAEAIVARYPAGGEVTVFVHPKNPRRSVLEYGVTPLTWVPLLLGLLVMSLAFFVR